MTEDGVYNVLFLCTHNSARSVMAECILNREGKGRFRAFSAGSQPSGRINPYVRALLERLDFPTDDLSSKDWNEFAKPDAPRMDFLHCLRQRRGRGLPRVARPSCHSALGFP